MIKEIIEELYASDYTITEIHNSDFIPLYYNIQDRYIFVPYELNQDDLNRIYNVQEKQDVYGKSYRVFADYITKEVAAFIQSKLQRHSSLKFDIYLIIGINTEVFTINHEEILSIENDRFCCRKIIFLYGSDCTKEDIARQFKNKFLFNKTIEDYKEILDYGSEKEEVKAIVGEESKMNEYLALEEFTFKELKDKLLKIYESYGIR